MKYLLIAVFFLGMLSTSNATAQKTNAEKILGCWKFKKIEFIEKNDFSEELIKEGQNTLVCFNADQKFTTTKPTQGFKAITGTYKVSADGKTIIQKRDANGGTADEDAEIVSIDDNVLVFKLEFGTIYFDRN